jgi:Cof subfamily protein (haloacid dehalogenase superfamily)
MNQLASPFHRISLNGAFIRTHQGEKLGSVVFEGDLARQIYKAAQSIGIFGFIGTDDRIFIPDRSHPMVSEVEERLKIQMEEHPNVLEEIGTTLKPSKLCYIGSREQMEVLEKYIHEKFPNQTNSYISDVDCIDFMPRNVSKGAALQVLINHLGLQPEEIACIGDSYNDISMFQLTPHSFVMEIADPEVKKYATHTVSSVAEAAQWVQQYNLSKNKPL